MNPALSPSSAWRLAATAMLAASLLLSCSLPEVAAGPVFFLVLLVCTAIVVLTRGLGWLRGFGIGLLAGVATSASLASRLSTTGSELLVFISVSSLLLCLLGGVAGAARLLPGRGPPHQKATAKGCNVPPPPPGEAANWQALMYSLADMADEFCRWTASSAGRQCCAESHDFSGFDQFVRNTLRRHLQAANVRVFELSSDGVWLEPLARPKSGSPVRVPAAEGAFGCAISSGNAVVNNDARQPPELPEALRQTWAPVDDSARQRSAPRWLLPLQNGTRTEALVTVERISMPRASEQRVARAVRTQLQLFWQQLCALRALARYLRTDRQTGMLERMELLSLLDVVVDESDQKPQPVMVLALALEGLRGLDDAGLWRQRDLLIEELGRRLRAKIRADDVIGRFSDDRFVVVLRGIDVTLATRVAEKLLQTVRSAVVENVRCPLPDKPEPLRLRIRAGLAGTGPKPGWRPRPFATFDAEPPPSAAPAQPPETGQRVLQRALQLIEYARRQRIELATDVMAGVPDCLARDASASVQTAGAGTSVSATNDTATTVNTTGMPGSESTPCSDSAAEGVPT